MDDYIKNNKQLGDITETLNRIEIYDYFFYFAYTLDSGYKNALLRTLKGEIGSCNGFSYNVPQDIVDFPSTIMLFTSANLRHFYEKGLTTLGYPDPDIQPLFELDMTGAPAPADRLLKDHRAWVEAFIDIYPEVCMSYIKENGIPSVTKMVESTWEHLVNENFEDKKQRISFIQDLQVPYQKITKSIIDLVNRTDEKIWIELFELSLREFERENGFPYREDYNLMLPNLLKRCGRTITEEDIKHSGVTDVYNVCKKYQHEKGGRRNVG